MTTTANTDRHRYLLDLLGPAKLDELSPITDREAGMLEAWFAEHPEHDFFSPLILEALAEDGSLGDPDAFAVLADSARLDAYLELVAR